MRIAGLIVGVLGSVAGFIGALLALLVGGLGGALDVEGAGTVTGLSFVAIGASIVGLVGAVLSMVKPRLAASMMLASAIVGVVAVFVAYILATVLLLIGAALTFFGRNENRGQTQSPGSV